MVQETVRLTVGQAIIQFLRSLIIEYKFVSLERSLLGAPMKSSSDQV